VKDYRLPVVGAALVPCLLVVAPMATANAHGYISSPASRQAQCAQGVVECGDIKYEPQSVEGPQGLRSCSAGISRFAELDDGSKPWRTTPVGNTTSFTWTSTAQHRTANWEYYIGNTRVGFVDGNNEQPDATVTHSINLSGFTGRQKLLAIWNIGDTANAFYSCVDLQIGDGDQPPTTTTPPTTTSPTTTTTPTTTTQPPTTTTPAPGEWTVGATYAVGDTVTYDGTTYRCLQSHTVNDPTWIPPNTPALWESV
jgi:predicted carbohydrate-binding protein with CBM5 and CBM33 domain